MIAGLTVWAVLVPESLAYASIAGVSPVVGLYAAPPALLLYALLGSSRHLIVARAQGLHRRAGADHHRRPAAQAVRRREGRRRLLREDLGPPRQARRHKRRRRSPPASARSSWGSACGGRPPDAPASDYRASRPKVAVLGRLPGGQWADVEREHDAEPQPGVAVLRVEMGLFFANAEHMRQQIHAHGRGQGVTAVVLDAETVPFVDVTAAEMLVQVRGDLHRKGIRLLVARAEDEAVAFPSVEDAVSRAR